MSNVFDDLPRVNRQAGPEFSVLDEVASLLRLSVRARHDDYYKLWNPLTCPAERLDVLAQDIGLERGVLDGGDDFFRHKALRFAEICRAKGTGFAIALMLKTSGIDLTRIIELWEVIDVVDPLETHYVEERPTGTPGVEYGKSSKFSLEIASEFVCFDEDQIGRIVALLDTVKPIHATLVEILATRRYSIIARPDLSYRAESVVPVIIHMAPWHMDSKHHPKLDNSGRVKMSFSLEAGFTVLPRRPALDSYPPMDLGQKHFPLDTPGYGITLSGRGHCIE